MHTGVKSCISTQGNHLSWYSWYNTGFGHKHRLSVLALAFSNIESRDSNAFQNLLPPPKKWVLQESLWDSNAFQNLLPHEEKNLSPAGVPVGLKCFQNLRFLKNSAIVSRCVVYSKSRRGRVRAMSRCVFYTISPRKQFQNGGLRWRNALFLSIWKRCFFQLWTNKWINRKTCVPGT